MASMKHTHKYYQTKMYNTITWACAHCSHFLPNGTQHTILGKKCICWSCGDEFMLDEMRLADALKNRFGRPYCVNCEDKEKGIDPNLLEELISQKLI